MKLFDRAPGQESKIAGGTVISTILKHDRKVTSYKIALLRSINDIVLSFPDILAADRPVAVPLRFLAAFWFAYYWPFVDRKYPIWQGQRSLRAGAVGSDMAFRGEMAQFRADWENLWNHPSRPSDGFFIINELLVPRKREAFTPDLLLGYQKAINRISQTIQMPIRHAGPGEWTVFERPLRLDHVREPAVAIPGTASADPCLMVGPDLWQSFQAMSLYIEALCIHEWCLYTERINHGTEAAIDRGRVYTILTDRADNRRPLTWERNEIELLLMEGREFVCPWTERRIRHRVAFDLDHLLPVSVYPINELWNLVPSDPHFNAHVKRDRLPTLERLARARPHLELAYSNYGRLPSLSKAIREDVGVRFSTVRPTDPDFPCAVATAVVNYIDRVGYCRNLSRF
jgi:hypothetical protein